MTDVIPGKIYVTNLPKIITNASLSLHFERFGEITDVFIIPGNAGRSKTKHGFVTFAEPSMAETALKVKDQEINGHKIICKPAYPKNSSEKKDEPEHLRKIFVARLDRNITADHLREYFSTFGPVEDSRIVTEKDLKSKGFGFVIFKNSSAVDEVQKKRPHKIAGKVIFTQRGYPDEATLDERKQTNTLYVNNYSEEANEDEICLHLNKTFGKISSTLKYLKTASEEGEKYMTLEFEDYDVVDQICLKGSRHIATYEEEDIFPFKALKEVSFIVQKNLKKSPDNGQIADQANSTRKNNGSSVEQRNKNEVKKDEKNRMNQPANTSVPRLDNKLQTACRISTPSCSKDTNTGEKVRENTRSSLSFERAKSIVESGRNLKSPKTSTTDKEEQWVFLGCKEESKRIVMDRLKTNFENVKPVKGGVAVLKKDIVSCSTPKEAPSLPNKPLQPLRSTRSSTMSHVSVPSLNLPQTRNSLKPSAPPAQDLQNPGINPHFRQNPSAIHVENGHNFPSTSSSSAFVEPGYPSQRLNSMGINMQSRGTENLWNESNSNKAANGSSSFWKEVVNFFSGKKG